MRSGKVRVGVAVVLAGLTATTPAVRAANHREAPITSLDRAADITDWYTFVSFNDPSKVTLILSVDPLLEPSNGPNYFPFDPGILYELKIDNDQDARPDVVFEVRFRTETRLPNVFTGLVGGIAGIPPITALDGPGSDGLSLRQSYSVVMRRRGQQAVELTRGRTLFAVPTNVGPRTMPNYTAPGGLFEQGIYDLPYGIRAFAGTTDDPFYIDLGAAFDSLNFRAEAGGGVLSAAQDADDQTNFAANDVSGFNVNTIALEVPIALLTRDGCVHPSSDPRAVLGTYGTTSRPQITVRRRPEDRPAILALGPFRQVQRMGNPLINELIIGTGFKDRFSMDDPWNDSQFSSFFLNPLLATIFSTLGIPVPTGDRTDLLPLVTYSGPFVPTGTPQGPIADLLRINTGIAPTPLTSQSRLGLLTLLDGNPSNDDAAGFPNGRRPGDDVTDIAARAVGGILKDAVAFGTRIGDGVNTDDMAKAGSFPYVNPAHSGRSSRHIDPGEPGCTGICPS